MSLLTQASLIVTPNAVKEGKLYSVIPSNGNGDMTVVRATGATRTNELGLIEPTPYNLLSYSEMFSDALWVKNASSISINTTNSPSGSLTADTLIDTSVNAIHRLRFGVSLSSLTNYTLSVYAKKNTLSFFQLALINTLDSATSSRVFDLQNGVLGEQLSTATLINSSITNVGNDWYLCSITASLPSNPNQFQITLATLATGNLTTANQVTYLGSGNGSIFLWGAQLVQGSVPKDYFYTTDRLNVPRLNYDSVGGCPSILVEPQRTNLVTYSQNFSDVSWIKSADVTVTPNIQDVSNTNTAARISITNQFSAIYKSNLFTTSGGTAVISAWIKRVSGSTTIGFRGNTSGVIYYNTINITNEWKRYDITFTHNGTNNIGIVFQKITSNIDPDVFDICFAQLEAGSYATSYVPTVATSVTRNADVITRNNIYTNNLITSLGGTWFIELNNNVSLTRDISGNGIWIGDNNTVSTIGNSFNIRHNGGTSRLLVNKSVNGVLTQLLTTMTNTVKIAIDWNGTTADIFVNGVKVITGTAFTTTNMEFLNSGGGGGCVPKYIKSMMLFPKPLTDAECIALTTL